MDSNFQVGEWVVEPGLNTIRKGSQVEHLEPKAMNVLVYLARHPDQVLERNQILDAVWPDTYVGDSTLTYAVVGLRKALGDDRKAPTYIQTIPKRGYRLVATVASESTDQSTQTDAGPPAKWWRSLVPALGIAAVLLTSGLLIYGAFWDQPRTSPFLGAPSLYVTDGQSVRKLSSGQEVKPGDELFLELENSASLYVYVFNEDEQGESYRLFPQPEYALRNPLPPKKRVRLPGSSNGEDLVWQVSSVGGREYFLIVTSQERLAEQELAASEFLSPAFGDDPTQPQTIESADPHRGIGRLKRTDSGRSSPRKAPFASLLAKLESRSGIWTHQLALENRGN